MPISRSGLSEMQNTTDRSTIESILASLDISEFAYTLPPERIAKFPLEKRDESNLLVYNKGEIHKDRFSSLWKYTNSKTLLVFNNSRVIQARIKFFKESGAKIEVFCLEPVEPADIQLAFQEKKNVTWRCLVGNQKKWKNVPLSKKVVFKTNEIVLTATRRETTSAGTIVQFSWNNPELTFSEVLEIAGEMPIPPYLKREPESIDRARYQTIYSLNEGSVAAPTAGLHFSNEVIQRLRKKGVDSAELTLHVGIGTFRPILSDSLVHHEMHTEHFSITIKSLKKICDNVSRMIAVGTTTVRTLESLYLLGIKVYRNNNIPVNELQVNQWDGLLNETDISPVKALKCLEDYMMARGINTLHCATRLMIVPGYRIRMTEALITNFHMPRSSLILLVAGYIGDDWRRVYQYALDNDFRFLSYVDSSMLFPRGRLGGVSGATIKLT